MLSKVKKWFFYLALILPLLILVIRTYRVEQLLGEHTSCEGCFIKWTIISDAAIVAGICCCLWLSLLLRSIFLRGLLRLLASIILVLYLVDFIILYLFTHRLYFADVKTYFNAPAIIEFLQTYPLAAFALLLFLVSLFVNVFNQIKSRALVISSFLIAIITLVVSFWPIRSQYIHDVYYRNFLSINLSTGLQTPYTAEKSAIYLADTNQCLVCNQSGAAQRKNIILVMVESLSMYQSQLFSGLNNWTPNLDRIAQQNRYFTNFHANNFTSSEGRIALLTGEYGFVPIKAFHEKRSKEGFWSLQHTLPRVLRKNGYQSFFIDGADLGFTQTGEFMQSLGFDHIEGAEYPGYEGAPRYAFNSVSDQVLYQRVLELTQSQQTPFFISAITVSSHVPFVVPETRELNLAKTIQYVDTQLAVFYDELIKSNYFDNGLLIITSDHRSMTPVSPAERDRFGLGTPSLVPLIIIDGQSQGQVHPELLQQSDLLNSIQSLVTTSYCRDNQSGNFLSNPPIPAQCVFHSRGDNRDSINVFCGSQQGTVKLDGDNTRFISGDIGNQQTILNRINAHRIRADQREQLWQQNTSNNNPQIIDNTLPNCSH